MRKTLLLAWVTEQEGGLELLSLRFNSGGGKGCGSLSVSA
jgi:hypothetical protein